MMAELVDTADLARIYAFIPLAHSAGASIGPFISDLLSRSGLSTSYVASVFGQASVRNPNTFFYLLTCSVPTMLSIASFVLALFYLKETVKLPAPISTLFKIPEVPADEYHLEYEAIHVIPTLHIRSPELQDSLAIGGAVASVMAKKLPFELNQLLSIRFLFKNPAILIALGNFAFLSVVDITFRAIQLLFLANPAHFGGLGLPAKQTDNIISACGISNGIIQLLFFAKIHDHLGPRKSFLCGVASAVPLFLMFPVMGFFAKYVGHGILLWLALGVQVILFIGFNLAFGAVFMYITASSPTPESVGTINGLSQMLSNSLQGVAPGMVSSLFVLSSEKNYLGGNLVYIVLVTIAAVAIMAAWYLPHKLWTGY
ncbi:hypothetical protein E4T56_gene5828 [Termitomyces sp. T112]|nr:hypothetical protein E4T56_gene5828 [Termitomyces sp. T112]